MSNSIVPALPEPVPALAKRPLIEVWFRRALMVSTALAASGVVSFFGILWWGQNEFSQPESVVASRARALVEGENLYPNLKTYPYTVAAYMPIYYGLEASLIRLGMRPFQAARLISFSAYLMLPALCWRLAYLYTRQLYCAWIAALLCGCSGLLLFWGTVGQVDAFAVMLGLAAFERFSQYWVDGRRTMVAATVFAIAALFTKQTMVACPLAIFLLLWVRSKKIALQFGCAFLGIGLGLVLLVNAGTHGNFLANTVFANVNPFAWEKLWMQLRAAGVVDGALILVAMVGAAFVWPGPARALLVYLGLACLIWLATAAKIGSDLNYLMETTVLLAIFAAVTLSAVDFFAHLFGDSDAWIALLQIPLAIYMLSNFRLMAVSFESRVGRERQFRQQMAVLRPLLAGSSPVISTDLNLLVQSGKRLEVEPLIYSLLVDAGRIDPEPLRQDLSSSAFPLVILFYDADHPVDEKELPGLPTAHLMEIRRHYQLAARVPGPYSGGVYVYRPKNMQAEHPAR